MKKKFITFFLLFLFIGLIVLAFYNKTHSDMRESTQDNMGFAFPDWKIEAGSEVIGERIAAAEFEERVYKTSNIDLRIAKTKLSDTVLANKQFRLNIFEFSSMFDGDPYMGASPSENSCERKSAPRAKQKNGKGQIVFVYETTANDDYEVTACLEKNPKFSVAVGFALCTGSPTVFSWKMFAPSGTAIAKTLLEKGLNFQCL